jgi:hypothetical protein
LPDEPKRDTDQGQGGNDPATDVHISPDHPGFPPRALRRRRHVQPDRSDFLRHDRSLNTERLNTSVSVQGESAVGQDGDG